MGSLIRTEPCEHCSGAAREPETGAGYCRRTWSGDCECAAYLEVRELEEIAEQIAILISRVSDEAKRHELATSTADGLANALYVQGAGAEFDAEAFLRACGCASVAVAA